MRIILKILAIAIITFVIIGLLPGVTTEDVETLMVVSLGLGLVNGIILTPLISMLKFPFTVLSIALFVLLINIAALKLADHFVDGFEVNGWLPIFVLSIVIAAVSVLVDNFPFRRNSFN